MATGSMVTPDDVATAIDKGLRLVAGIIYDK